jgi:hypothetical protein
MLDVASVGGQAQGDGGQFYALLQPWDANTTTWNSWTNGIQADGVKAALSPTAVAGNSTGDPNVQGGYHAIDLTADVRAWVSGSLANNGWVVIPWTNGNDGWGINGSESVTERDRPQLRIYFTAATSGAIRIGSISRGASSVSLQFTGSPNTTYSVMRASTLGGTWSPVGPAGTDGSGVASFTDNTPPTGAAFYRISSP